VPSGGSRAITRPRQLFSTPQSRFMRAAAFSREEFFNSDGCIVNDVLRRQFEKDRVFSPASGQILTALGRLAHP